MNYLQKKLTTKKMFNRKYFLLFFILLFFISYISSEKTIADYFSQVNVLASECFNRKNVGSCRAALAISETYQSYASSKNNYRCQTSLLALEAHIIMVVFNSSINNRLSSQALMNVKRTCNDLFLQDAESKKKER